MGSIESTHTPWEEWFREEQLSDISDAYGSFHKSGGGPEELFLLQARGYHTGRHELHGRTGDREGKMAEGESDPSSGLRLPEKHPCPVSQFDLTEEDAQNLYNELVAEGDPYGWRGSDSEEDH